MDLSRVSEWVESTLKKKGETVRFAVFVAEGNRTFSNKGSADVEAKDAETVCEEVRQIIRDQKEAYEADDKAFTKVKVTAYGPKSAYLTENVFKFADTPATEESSAKGEMAGILRESRLALAEANARVETMVQLNTRVALQAMDDAAKTQAQLFKALEDRHNTEIALVANQKEETYDPMKELVDQLKPVLPVVLTGMVQEFMQSRAKKAAREEEEDRKRKEEEEEKKKQAIVLTEEEVELIKSRRESR